MNRTNQKPGFFRYFTRRLASCLVTASLVGATFTAALYYYRMDSVRRTHWDLHKDLAGYLETVRDVGSMSDTELSGLLAHRIAFLDPACIDMALLLTRQDTGSTCSSDPMFCALSRNDGLYYSSDAALLEANTRTGISARETRTLSIRDIYVQEDTGTFYPGVVEIVRTPRPHGMPETIETIDLTPADVRGYTHMTYGGKLQSVAAIGSAADSRAMAALQSGTPANSFWTLHPAAGEPFSVQVSDSAEGTRFRLQSAVVYHFWHEQQEDLLTAYGILAALACLAAAAAAAVGTSRARRVWEQEAYRRQLTNALAHDLRTPLTAITGYAENLRSGIRPEKQAHYTDAILQNTAYMDRIISDVLELSVLETSPQLDRTQTDLVQCFREAFAPYALQLEERSVTLRIEGNCTALADGRMMAQAAGNLASNAVRYTPDGGEITVSGHGGELTIANTCHETGDAAALLEPFARQDKARRGHSSGLGLTIVRQIMELHGFRLTVQLQDGKWTAVLRTGTK